MKASELHLITVKEIAHIIGKSYAVTAAQLKRGYCAFPRIEILGQRKNPAYGSWRSMIQRCTNPKSRNYYRYGHRGITVHPDFRQFTKFIKHIGPRPSLKHSIERIDVHGNYEPGNVKWATAKEQQNNKQCHHVRV